MSFLTNKHFIVALLVAPILAILAWYGTDMIVAETPVEPVAGKSYKLAERPSCRWKSGVCSVKNNNFEIEFKVEQNADSAKVTLDSNFALDAIQMAVFLPKTKQELTPTRLQATDETGLHWQADLDWIETDDNRLRLAVQKNGVFYFGEVSTTFMQKE